MATVSKDISDRNILISIGLIGASALTTQLILMRELLTTFNGNELSIAIILGNWLFLSGIGSYIGRHFSFKTDISIPGILHLLIALIPIIELITIRLLRNKIFIRGSLIGITEMVVSTFILLLPFCVISGFFLVLACELASGRYSSGKIYISDSIGSVIGGIFFSFLLLQFFDHFKILAIVSMLNFLFSIVLFYYGRFKLISLVSGIILIITAVIAFRYDIDFYLTQKQFPEQKLLFSGNSPQGRIVATEYQGQINFIENGVPLSPSHNLQQAEETVHFAMAQRPQAKTVLLIGGGYTGTAQEILKYNVDRIDYVEIDALIISLTKQFLKEKISSQKINIINTDGRKHIRETTEKYDVIIIDVPDPTTSQINRFYTLEFFKECLRVLKPDGVISFGIAHYENYVSEGIIKILSTTSQTLRQCLKNILIIPAGRVYFIASNGNVSSNIADEIEQLEIQTRYVRRGYLNSIMTPDRLADIKEASSHQFRINRDFNPVLYFYNIQHWMSQFRIKFGLLEFALLGIMAVYIFKMQATELTIFASGFTGASLEIVLLFAFQIIYGSLYLQLSLIVTLFMCGLTFGGLCSNYWINNKFNSDEKINSAIRRLFILTILLALIGALIYPALWIFSKLILGYPFVSRCGIPAITFIVAFIAGSQFPIACAVASERKIEGASKIYTADFIGSSFGSMLAGTLLIPLIGVFSTCAITSLFNFLCAILLYFNLKKIG